MGYPRKLLVDSTVPSFYHCISRCVRRAFLCGEEYEHRRQWLEKRLAELLSIFAIRSCAYAIMSNHLHLILKIDPALARSLSDVEVARRWVKLYSKTTERIRRNAGGGRKGEEAVELHIQNLSANKAVIDELRQRLCDLGWFHKLLKEPIARRANEEDGCTGHFWEGRFKSYRLLDQGALLACTVYVDLNPWRARLVTALKDSAFTSLLQRMKVLQAERRPRPSKSASTGRKRGKRKKSSLRQTLGELLLSTRSLFQMTTKQYLSLVARTAGVPTDQIDHDNWLRSLDIDPERWLEALSGTAKLFGSVVGGAGNRLVEADRRGAQRVVNALDVFESG